MKGNSQETNFFPELMMHELLSKSIQDKKPVFQPIQTDLYEGSHEDRTSELPNEVLSCILSFLTLKEAGRTSVLSKRWKLVWTCVPELDFYAFVTLYEVDTREEYSDRMITERHKFVNWVNKVLQSHQSMVLNKFRIYCDLNDSLDSELNKWLQYASVRRVQKLEVNLSHHGQMYHIPTTETYVFPSAVFAQRSWSFLKELILKCVLVSGVTLESLLHNCKYLESLGVHCSKVLTTLDVCGPSLALQHLEINFCPLKSLIIRNVNLVSLKIGMPRSLLLANGPQLVNSRVEKLELNLSHHSPGYNIPTSGSYVLPFDIHAQTSWSFLKELVLKCVLVSGGTLEFLLHNCKYLESLRVYCSRDLVALKVCGPSLALQHLEIKFCTNFKTLIISNANLRSLKIGLPGALVLENVPQLVHIGLLTPRYNIEDTFHRLSCSFSKLEVLSLCLHPEQVSKFDRKLPQLPALKQLSLELFLLMKQRMSGFTSFFRASPKLETFVFKPIYFDKIRTYRELEENFVHYPVEHLRVVEVYGYRGQSIEFELVKYVLEHAISLEKIIVDPRYKLHKEDFISDFLTLGEEAEITTEARRCTKQQLLGAIPSHVTLHIL